MRAVCGMLALVVSLAVVGNLWAAEEKSHKDGKHQRPGMDRMEVLPEQMLKGLNLTDDQKTKVEALKKEYGPKVKDAWQKTESVLTEDQKKARGEAMKAAKAAGKKGPEAFKDVQAAVKLTDEQKAKMDEARKSAQAVRKEVREKFMAMLTPEQKEQLKKDRENHGKRDHKSKDK
jgi:Spy/CpxP family protein refolding chaperone